MSQKRYFRIYKPYGMLSQFTREGNHPTLADLGSLPPDIYPIGRLDADSEGLLLLTNNPVVNGLLLNPAEAHERTYWVQVDGDISAEAIAKLQQPMVIKLKTGLYTTLPCKAHKMETPDLPPRIPSIRFRKDIPTSWVEIKLIEGKNRQVRKMTAAVGFPTLRLVRVCMEVLKLGMMQPGEVKEVTEEKFFASLRIEKTRGNQKKRPSQLNL